MSRLKEFQRYPLWMKHQEETTTGRKPIMVHNEKQEEEYVSKGYVSPVFDVEFFNEASVQNEVGRQFLSVVLACSKYQSGVDQLLSVHMESMRVIDMQNRKIDRLEMQMSDLSSMAHRLSMKMDVPQIAMVQEVEQIAAHKYIEVPTQRQETIINKILKFFRK